MINTDSTECGLFRKFGLELEYMIVDSETLSVSPICDVLLHDVAGEYTDEVNRGRISWSNELALHVVELKTSAPVLSIEAPAADFHEAILEVNARLSRHGARLMPSAMHPWMDPDHELQLWPHDHSPIYETFNRIFDCRGHGWSNLQSMHINLPFADDDEFDRLHTAIRLLLPIMPGLSSSSPVVAGIATGMMDTRLETYRTNSRRIPSITGIVVPEPVRSREEYIRTILEPMYRDIAPHDPQSVLQHEWLNARGAIARFDRNAIEIRVLDVQECPRADLAIAAAIVAVLRALTIQTWTTTDEQRSPATAELSELLTAVAHDAERTVIKNQTYLRQFGLDNVDAVSVGELWRHLLSDARLPVPIAEIHRPALRTILDRGPLARRILGEVPPTAEKSRWYGIYARLCDCLESNRLLAEDASA